MFTITVPKISEFQEKNNPHIVKIKGGINQHPDWEEDFNDE